MNRISGVHPENFPLRPLILKASTLPQSPKKTIFIMVDLTQKHRHDMRHWKGILRKILKLDQKRCQKSSQ